MRTLDIQRTVFTVTDFIGWARDGSLVLSPNFQRRPVWPLKAKSYLIDTVVNDLPMPVIFIRESVKIKTLKMKREVVDGQQRLRTILSYVDPECLKDFNEETDSFSVLKMHNEELAGKKFEELSNNEKRQILGYQFSVDVLPNATSDRDILEIFSRMNATGMKLNNQELRNAAYYGEFKQEMYKASMQQLERWRDWEIFTQSQIARMNDVELTSELIMYIMEEEVMSKTKKTIDVAYEENDDEFKDKNIYLENFETTFNFLERAFRDEISDTAFSRAPLFYSLFTVAYDFRSANNRITKLQTAKFGERIMACSKRIVSREAPEEVLDAMQQGLGHQINRETVRHYIKKSLRGI